MSGLTNFRKPFQNPPWESSRRWPERSHQPGAKAPLLRGPVSISQPLHTTGNATPAARSQAIPRKLCRQVVHPGADIVDNKALATLDLCESESASGCYPAPVLASATLSPSHTDAQTTTRRAPPDGASAGCRAHLASVAGSHKSHSSPLPCPQPKPNHLPPRLHRNQSAIPRSAGGTGATFHQCQFATPRLDSIPPE
jgi:hypothetical protein